MPQNSCHSIVVICLVTFFANSTILDELAFAAEPGDPEWRAVDQWDLDTLNQTPEMRWLSQDGAVHSLLYSGEPYEGHPTEVFAFYATPVTVGDVSADEAQDQKFPGAVLIHGGGGTAFAEWVWLWAKRGYAAIAMDLSGSRPIDPVYDAKGVPVPNQAAGRDTRTRLSNGGPDQGHPQKFDSIGGEQADDWPYHAVASVVRAHSLLRSFPEVDAKRTAVTGISWGGYTTCLVASVDRRFQAAVPVYGCGFLYEGESVQKPAIDKLGDLRGEWIRRYDPSSLLKDCQVPIFFVNGTNDVHYPLDSYQKSYDVVPGPKEIRIEVQMRHSHPAGWAPKEIGLFIDAHCKKEAPLPQLASPQRGDGHVTVGYESAVPLKEASLHYSVDSGRRSVRKWESRTGTVESNRVSVAEPPKEANTWFVSVTDERGAMVTTPVQFQQN
ncbi:MAG: acetylxylan esterase [Planctomycetaceae bacterium]|nr:acetylxylan esterase [Planctomycetaceae bacterium]